MAITEPTTARVLRGAADEVGGHVFSPVGDLPRVSNGRPRQTGNKALDAIRSTGWDEGYADGRERGRQDGHAEGFELGRSEGLVAGRREGVDIAQQEALALIEARVGRAIEALEAAAQDLSQREAATFAEVEHTAIELGLALAEAILDSEVSSATDPGRDALRRALALAPDHDHLTAHLHPADLEGLGEVADLAPGRRLELVADPSVGPGSCVLAAGAARIDARIDTALQRAREALSS